MLKPTKNNLTHCTVIYLLVFAVYGHVRLWTMTDNRVKCAKDVRNGLKKYDKTEGGGDEPPDLGRDARVRISHGANASEEWIDDEKGMDSHDPYKHRAQSLSNVHPDVIRMAPEVFEKVPREFLADFKSPCWRDNQNELFCLPSFYVIGLHKCGTTDLWFKLVRHPDVVETVLKEPHWWGRRRHGIIDYKQIPPHKREARKVRLRIGDDKDDSSFDWYLTWFKMLGVQAVKSDPSRKIFGDASISTAFGVGESWGTEHKNYTNADLIHAVQPKAKIILLVRNPADRFFSQYFYKSCNKNKTLEDFHKAAVSQMDCFTNYRRNYSERHCSFTRQCTMLSTIHVAIAEDWTRLYGRDGVYVLRLEDWHANMADELTKLITFLDLPALSKAEISNITRRETVNVNDRTAHLTMWNTTRDLLQDFFKPFNQRFAELMNDQRFLLYNQN